MSTRSRVGVLLVVLALLLTATVGPVAAQTGQFGGAVVVGEDETVNGDLQVVGGSVTVLGTVNGDVQAAGGDILVAGTVTGNVQAGAGSITITGTVGGNVDGGAGSVTIGDTATIGGNVQVGAASVVIAGTVAGDVRAGGDTITLAPTADIRGDLVYDGRLVQEPGAAVAGTVRHDPTMGGWSVGPFSPIVPDYAGTVYGVLVSLLLGAILLTVVPDFSDDISGRVRGDVGHSAIAGVLAIVVGVVAIVLVAITIVGIPIAILIAVVLGLTAWAGSVLGQYAVGDYVLRRTGREDRWLALAVGVVGLALVGLVPILGGIVTGVVGLLGFGALVAALYDRYVGGRDTERSSPDPASV